MRKVLLFLVALAFGGAWAQRTLTTDAMIRLAGKIESFNFRKLPIFFCERP